jgi:amylosucrase
MARSKAVTTTTGAMDAPKAARPKRPAARLTPGEQRIFELRFDRSRADLFGPLDHLYGHLPDYERFTGQLVQLLRRNWRDRPKDLKDLDLRRDLEPDWFLRETMVGYVFYIDRFAGTLADLPAKLDYLEELGVTYVHLMPCLKPREGDNDGGYSVQDYRQIDPRLGTMAEFEAICAAFRARGISPCIDMVLNHTAKEHDWALRARAGSEKHRAYYRMFESDETPREYEKTLLEIFPNQAPGNFTYYENMDRWVWTTFNEHQWDLNWENPEVFLEILDVMLFLANRGAEVLRLDAVAFMWKRLGTQCQNLPEVHHILQALRAACRIASPAVIHKAEAIVAPDQLLPYLGTGAHTGKVANLAYHNSLMVQFWSALASRDTGLMTHVLRTHFPSVHRNATWGTYLRCHDDIGWAITDEDAGHLGFSGFGHRQFLADFYEGVFPGSFARGGRFQYNPVTQDRRTNGTMASLCGLETALEAGNTAWVDDAIARILMGHALIASFGGVPLLYMGDELAMLNDYDWAAHSRGEDDSRWMHRLLMDWERAEARTDTSHPAGRVYAGLRAVLAARKATPELHADVPRDILEAPHAAVFAFRRMAAARTLVAVFNFSEQHIALDRGWLSAQGVVEFEDRLTGQPVQGAVTLAPYQVMWLV